MATIARKTKIKYFGFSITLVCIVYISKNLLIESLAPPQEYVNMHGHSNKIGHHSIRHLLSESNNETCTPPAILEFPRDLMNNHQRLHGGILLHVLGAIYMFGAITIICDDYFVPVLDVICERCNLQSDVAGATFMALGSSAPELFASVIGVFVTKGDIGTGTILGSAVFNVLFVIGVCALFSGHVLRLSWWPIVRDLMSYLLALIALVLVIMDDVVQWYEAIIMMCSYSFYLILMYFNSGIEKYLYHITNTVKERQLPLSEHNYGKTPPVKQKPDQRDISSGEENDLGGLRETALLIQNRDDDVEIKQDESNPGTPDKNKESHLTELELAIGNPFHPPKGKYPKFLWCLALPLNVCFHYTIPDVRKPNCRKYYPLSFIMCIIWIALTSYGLVWMVTVVGFTFGVPDTVMGLTLVAFGSSVPDCISSLVVAKKGDGDMACSHTVGSNVFDILLCLGLPWTIKTMICEYKTTIILNSHGLFISSFFIMASILLTFLMMHFHDWTLTKTVGITYLLVYLIFITIACVIELNVFAHVSPPMCAIDSSY